MGGRRRKKRTLGGRGLTENEKTLEGMGQRRIEKGEDGVRKRSTADHRGTVSLSFIDAVQNTPPPIHPRSIPPSCTHSSPAPQLPPDFIAPFAAPSLI